MSISDLQFSAAIANWRGTEKQDSPIGSCNLKETTILEFLEDRDIANLARTCTSFFDQISATIYFPRKQNPSLSIDIKAKVSEFLEDRDIANLARTCKNFFEQNFSKLSSTRSRDLSKIVKERNVSLLLKAFDTQKKIPINFVKKVGALNLIPSLPKTAGQREKYLRRKEALQPYFREALPSIGSNDNELEEAAWFSKFLSLSSPERRMVLTFPKRLTTTTRSYTASDIEVIEEMEEIEELTADSSTNFQDAAVQKILGKTRSLIFSGTYGFEKIGDVLRHALQIRSLTITNYQPDLEVTFPIEQLDDIYLPQLERLIITSSNCDEKIGTILQSTKNITYLELDNEIKSEFFQNVRLENLQTIKINININISEELYQAIFDAAPNLQKLYLFEDWGSLIWENKELTFVEMFPKIDGLLSIIDPETIEIVKLVRIDDYETISGLLPSFTHLSHLYFKGVRKKISNLVIPRHFAFHIKKLTFHYVSPDVSDRFFADLINELPGIEELVLINETLSTSALKYDMDLSSIIKLTLSDRPIGVKERYLVMTSECTSLVLQKLTHLRELHITNENPYNSSDCIDINTVFANVHFSNLQKLKIKGLFNPTTLKKYLRTTHSLVELTLDKTDPIDPTFFKGLSFPTLERLNCPRIAADEYELKERIQKDAFLQPLDPTRFTLFFAATKVLFQTVLKCAFLPFRILSIPFSPFLSCYYGNSFFYQIKAQIIDSAWEMASIITNIFYSATLYFSVIFKKQGIHGLEFLDRNINAKHPKLPAFDIFDLD